MKKLYRTEGPYKMIAGVCGGIGEYFGIDPTLIRLAWAVLTVFTASALFWVYVVSIFIIPRKSDVYPGY